MSILILSDTHGLVSEVKKVVARHQVEHILHCGDFCVDKAKEPFSSMQLVRGNCDTDRSVPEERQTKWRDLRIYQTHGHLYNVKSSLLRLTLRAEEVGANVVLFGNSHVPVCDVDRRILFINPGSLQLPRYFSVPTYAILRQLAAGAGSVEVEVLFYDYHGNPVSVRGGQFSVRG